MVVALAQMMQSDEVVIDEARRSIGGLTASEMNRLNELRRLAARCESLREDRSSWHPAEKAEPGDIAIHQPFGSHCRSILPVVYFTMASGAHCYTTRIPKIGVPARRERLSRGNFL